MLLHAARNQSHERNNYIIVVTNAEKLIVSLDGSAIVLAAIFITSPKTSPSPSPPSPPPSLQPPQLHPPDLARDRLRQLIELNPLHPLIRRQPRPQVREDGACRLRVPNHPLRQRHERLWQCRPRRVRVYRNLGYSKLRPPQSLASRPCRTPSMATTSASKR